MSFDNNFDELKKEKVEQERSASAQANSEHNVMPVNFKNYITSLGLQAMIFLGEVDNPITRKPEKDLKQAKFLIDTLDLLKEKTTGNLSQDENELLNNSVYQLQMKYVELVKKG